MLREPMLLLFGEDKIVVYDHLENAVLALDQLRLYPELF
jgi:hypothetical protein